MEVKNKDILLQVKEAMALNNAVGAMLKQDEDFESIKVVCNVLGAKLLTVETMMEWKAEEVKKKYFGTPVGTGKTEEAMRLDSLLEEGGGGLHG